MTLYHIWITVALPFDEANTVNSFIKRGYDISPASDDGKLMLVSSDHPSYGVLACKLQTELVSARQLYDDLWGLLSANKTNYYSLVVSEYSYNAIWTLGVVGQQPTNKNYRGTN